MKTITKTNMKKTLAASLLFAVLCVGTPVLAATPDAAQCKAERIAVKVNGLVCDFCARALEKVFSKQDSVTGIQVDLAAGHIAVDMKPNMKMDDATLTKLITDSGYNVREIDRECAG